MPPSIELPTKRDLRGLCQPLEGLAEQGGCVDRASIGEFIVDGMVYEIPCFTFTGPPVAHDRIKIGIFGGLHGDEPASAHAAVHWNEQLAKSPLRGSGYDLHVYPVCNPTGYEDDTRHTRAGKDLNREFWRGSGEPEIAILEAELRSHRFDGIITLHADDTCDGLYGYTHGRVINEALLKPALRAAERVLPRDGRGRIDGFSAQEGLICDCFRGVLAAPPDQSPQPFDVIFETPATAPLDTQVSAAVLALGAILDEYRGFIAYAQNL